MSGLIHIYTGDGKGKTTAAVGLTVRCAGYGDEVVFAQFLKNNRSSERNILEQIDKVHIISSEKVYGFYKNLSPEQRAEAKVTYTKLLTESLAKAKETNCRMLVLDEIIATYNHDLIDKEMLLDFLKQKPEELEVVMTGRNPAEELVELADYVSEIRKIKHPFDQGIPARKGIEK
ncbi:MAG: cob(I)yrinic acid a,c-diamide adenosyltransferase [Bacillota bacterium]|nr:cob(I)yrinic acid a,c-diamide adenosyltransferase [Bacillota bacterium]